MIVLNFRGQLQCRMGGKQQGPIEAYPKLWNLNPLENQAGEILRIPAWTKAFELTRRELGVILERDWLAATFFYRGENDIGLKSPSLVTSVQAKRIVERQHKVFTHCWDPYFIGFSAAVHFYSSERKSTRGRTQRDS